MSFEKVEAAEFEEPKPIARGNWAKSRILADFHPDPSKQDKDSSILRDVAIEAADFDELNGALDRINARLKNARLKNQPASAEDLTALAKIRSRMDTLIREHQQ